MPLQGTLESFGLSEILQLVSQQGKTGVLEIRTGDGTARIRFLEGRVVEAWPDHRSPSELIGALLVRGGLVTPAQLERALDEQIESLRPLGDLLVRMGAVRIGDFQEVLCLQHRETMYKLLRLKRGSFNFVSEPVEAEEGVSTPMEVGPLLMEGFRQIDEWPRVLEKVPSESRVYERVGQLGPGELEPGEQVVFALVDGVASVRELVDRARLGEFAGWEAVAHLLEAGYISPLGGAAALPRQPEARRSSKAWDVTVALLLLLLTAALLAARLSTTGHASAWTTALCQARREAVLLERRAEEWNASRPRTWPAVTLDSRQPLR